MERVKGCRLIQQLMLVMGLVLLVSCSDRRQETAPSVSDPPHLLLVSIDTLRADHLGIYGYPRDTSPRLDTLTRQSVRFTAAYAPTPWTFPSHASMLTGMHPWEIGIDNSFRTIPEETSVVAEHLARRGYQTAAFVDSHSQGFVGAKRGFGRGFAHYAHAPHRGDLVHRFDMAATVDAALEWLEGRDASRPFFLFLHTKSVHAVPNNEECLDPRCAPYEKPEPFQHRFVSPEDDRFSWTSSEEGSGQRYLWSQNEKIVRGELDPESYPRERLEVLEALYDAGIYYTDFHLGRLFDELRQRGLFEKTAVIVTSDHGEAFLDHALFMHQEVYDPLLRVPLIVRLPEDLSVDEERSVDHPVLLSDVTPTLLKLAHLDAPASMTGRPLPLGGTVGNAEENREVFSYYLFPSKFTYQALALRRGDWKLVIHNIEAPDNFRRELYNTALDPGEKSPVEDEEALKEEMRQALRQRLHQRPVAQGVELVQQDLPNLEAIRSLGYVE